MPKPQSEENALWDAEKFSALVKFYTRKIDSTSASERKKKEYSYLVFQRAAAHLSMEPSNYALAKPDVELTLDLDPECPNAHTSMADILNHEDTTASCQRAVEHATKALESKHPGNEWKKASVRFQALTARANARFELLDDKKMGFSEELSNLAEQDLKTLINTKWKDFEPDEETVDDLKDKLTDIQAEVKKRKAAAKPAAAAAKPAVAAKPVAAPVRVVAVGASSSAVEGSGGKGQKRALQPPEQLADDAAKQQQQQQQQQGKRTTAKGPVRTWTKEDVAEWLPTIGNAYVQFKKAFVNNGVDGALLLGVIGGNDEGQANDELEYTLEVKSVIHRAAIINAVKKLRR